MSRLTFIRTALLFVGPELFLAAGANADPAYVTDRQFQISLSGLSTLQFTLLDNGTFPSDSWALIDNVTYHSADGSITYLSLNFNNGTLSPFAIANQPYDSGYSANLSGLGLGSLNGSVAMRLDGGGIDYSTIAAADDLGLYASGILEFDLEFVGLVPTEDGANTDQFLISINGTELSDGALSVSLGEIHDIPLSQSVPVPAPALLTAIGLGCVGLVRRLRPAL